MAWRPGGGHLAKNTMPVQIVSNNIVRVKTERNIKSVKRILYDLMFCNAFDFETSPGHLNKLVNRRNLMFTQ